MRKKLCFMILFLLLSNEIVLGKNDTNKNNIHKKSNKAIEKNANTRGKRSLIKIFDKGNMKLLDDDYLNVGHDLQNRNVFLKYANDFGDEKPMITPFWGNRGRRDSSESVEYMSSADISPKDDTCKSCSKYTRYYQPKEMMDDIVPFWSNRGKKDSDESNERMNIEQIQDDKVPPFWGNRGKKELLNIQDNAEYPPFWSSRGRRDDIEPFWGNRGRRDEMEPFWGNRGRRDEIDPFWGNRGRRDEMKPFWGSRGRRQDDEPFWGTRGRRETNTPIWGNLGKSKEYKGYWTSAATNPFWGIRGRRKFALKQNIINAMNNIEYDIEKLSRLRRGEENSFWNNRGRDSTLNYLFNDPLRSRLSESKLSEIKAIPTKLSIKSTDPKTVNDDQIFVEQPHYILIERSSRSSSEDDPFFISRGKKYTNVKLSKNIRGRRGAIEDLVKSVRNDPYYIARGKKDSEHVNIGNSTIPKQEFLKAKELMCSAIDLMDIKNSVHKVKRDVDDSERERRTILKKLAAELQIDPYFVSRGKKNEDTDTKDDHLEEFINRVSDMCN